MKKYQLIREYPGSPKLGYILKPIGKKINHSNLKSPEDYYYSGNYFEPAEFPQFWEEVKEGYDKFKPPFRVGKKKRRVVLDSLGHEVVIFSEGLELIASDYVEFLNKKFK